MKPTDNTPQPKPSGEKSSAPLSPADILPLKDQLRELYGRTAYSQKTHIIQSGLDKAKSARIKFAELALSMATTGGVLSVLLGTGPIGAAASTISAALLTALLAWTKDYDLARISEMHKRTADELWHIREKYLDLLTDLETGAATPDYLMQRRDQLREELNATYAAARVTTYLAYAAAQKGLKHSEDLTFSDDEIDIMLPASLRKNKTITGPAVTDAGVPAKP